MATTYKFYEGENKILNITLKTKNECGVVEPFVIPGNNTIEVTLPGDPANIVKTTPTGVTIVNRLLGEIAVNVVALDTTTLVSGSIKIKITDTTTGDVRIAVGVGVIEKLVYQSNQTCGS